MSPSKRMVLPEILDDLAPEDPRAKRSRRDLQRVHVVMRTVSIMRRLLQRLQLASAPRRIIEIGAGDGTLLLRLAHACKPRWSEVELTLMDRLDIVTAQTRHAYEALGWRVTAKHAEALAWARQPDTERYDLCIANLFLHHFDDAALRVILGAIADRADALLACEPRRDWTAHLGSRLVGIVGGNDVTRRDAVTSVAAGFTQRELADLWPAAAGAWRVEEFPAWPFSHCFIAARATRR